MCLELLNFSKLISLTFCPFCYNESLKVKVDRNYSTFRSKIPRPNYLDKHLQCKIKSHKVSPAATSEAADLLNVRPKRSATPLTTYKWSLVFGQNSHRHKKAMEGSFNLTNCFQLIKCSPPQTIRK